MAAPECGRRLTYWRVWLEKKSRNNRVRSEKPAGLIWEETIAWRARGNGDVCRRGGGNQPRIVVNQANIGDTVRSPGRGVVETEGQLTALEGSERLEC